MKKNKNLRFFAYVFFILLIVFLFLTFLFSQNSAYKLVTVASDALRNTITSSLAMIGVGNVILETTNVLAEWKFDEGSGQTIIDTSGSGNNGFLGSTSATESADPTWSAGIIGSALDFDAVDDYVEIPDNPSLRGMSELSITAWVKRSVSGGTWRYIVRTFPNSNQYTFFFDTTDSLRFFPRNSVGGKICDVSSGATKVTADSNWHFVAGTYDGINCKAYIDGSLIATITSTGEPIRDTIQSIRIGSDLGGIIDEVRIYNKSLSATEVLDRYNQGRIPSNDTEAPTVSITSPSNGAIVSGTITITATASDNIGVAGVQFKVDGSNVGVEDTISPYSVSLDTTTLTNSLHTLTAVARDVGGNQATSIGVNVTVSNVAPPPGGITLTLQPSQTKQTWLAWWGTMSSPIFGITSSDRMPLSVFNQMLDDLASDFGLTGA